MAARATDVPQKLESKNTTETLSLEEKIRKRAHEIYLQQGGQAGSDLDHWLQAEAEIRQIYEDS